MDWFKYANRPGFVIQLPKGTWVSAEGETDDPTRPSVFYDYQQAMETAERTGGMIVPFDQLLDPQSDRLSPPEKEANETTHAPQENLLPWTVDL